MSRLPSRWESAPLCSRLSFAFISPILKLGKTTNLQDTDLPYLSTHDSIFALTNRLQKEWEHELQNNNDPSLWSALYRAEKWSFWFSALMCFGESCTRIGQPVMLGIFLEWLTSSSQILHLSQGISIGLGLSCVALLQIYIHHLLYFYTMRGGWNARMSMTALIHRKLLTVHSGTLSGENGDGNIVNLVSNDVFRFDSFFPQMHFGWSGTLDFVVCFLLMILKVGWYASIAGVAVIVLMMPIQLCCSKRLSGIRRTTAAATDQRVQRTSEIFDGILAVKSAVWEDAFQSEIHTLRSTERWSIFRAMLIKAFNSGIHFATPYVATLLTFLTYWAQGNELSVSTVFSAMSLLHVLRVSIGKNLTYFIETLPEVLVSTKRLKKFLLLPEKKKKTKINKKSNATTTSSTTQEKVKIELNNLTFSWGCGSISSPHIPVVRNISLHMKPGELLVITGSTGCGKTALLKGIAGELDGEPMSGDESGDESGDGDNRIVNGSMAIVNQIPWIMSGSLKSNIVWSGTTDTNGNTNDRSDESNETNAVNDDDENFTNVLNRCGLAEDVLQWKDGVNTIIGEKGINLSGGQRARVSLARAIYADRDILLIDGVLSAVDPSVANTLLEEVILPLCREEGKIVCVATHSVELCKPHADVFLELNHNGKIIKQIIKKKNKIQDLQDNNGIETKEKTTSDTTSTITTAVPVENTTTTIETAAAVSAASATAVSATTVSTVTTSVDVDVEIVADKEEEENHKKNISKSITPTSIILKEERTLGSVRCSTYCNYLNSAGPIFSLSILILFIGGQTCALLADVSLEGWGSDTKDLQADSTNIYFQNFVYFTIATSIIGLLRSVAFYYIGLHAATVIHSVAFKGVIDSPLSYFTSNPLGRILNKFSADMGQMDEQLPTIMHQCLNSLFLCIGCIVLAVYAIPWMILPVLPLTFVMWYVRDFFLHSSRDLKRLESISKSPIFVSFSANLRGRDTIRIYGNSNFATERFEECLSVNGRAWFGWLNVNRWVGFRLDSITLVVLTCVVLVGAVLGWQGAIDASDDSSVTGNYTATTTTGSSGVDHGLLAIAITYCIQMSGVFQYMVRLSAKVETQMIAVERLSHLTTLPSEHQNHNNNNNNNNNNNTTTVTSTTTSSNTSLINNWPTLGGIEWKNVSVRYRSDLPIVLSALNISIKGGHKVGICGRTGSGKSSMMLALCRLNEICQGNVLIDGINTNDISLKQLRKSIGVIPQTPSLFAGTLRYNIDPTGVTYSDSDMKDALSSVGMRVHLDRQDGLNMIVEENGRNLSVGEKQCVSLARALLSKSPLYVLDEATANIDRVTDERIQLMMRTHPVFVNATVLTVAHRLSTIQDSDQIIVLDNGKLLEMGTPSDLMEGEGKNGEGAYAKMVREYDEQISK